MRKIALASFFGLLSAVTACGGSDTMLDTADATAEQAIINGEACGKDELPTTVAILVDAVIDLGGFGTFPIQTVMCTGTVIAPDVVLTAAHCLDPSLMTQGFGTVTSEAYFVSFEPDLAYMAEQGQGGAVAFPADAIQAAGWKRHSGFNIEELNQTVGGPGEFDDVGLLFFDTDLGVHPMTVIAPDEADQIQAGTTVEIAGWGQQTEFQGGFGEAPPAGTVGVKVCATSTINEVGSKEMQIGSDQSSSRKCHGDSGGPTYLEVSEGEWRVVGITSHAYDQTDCAKGGVDTRVDAYLDWIDTEMKGACSTGTRGWCEIDGIIPPGYFDPKGNGNGGNQGGEGGNLDPASNDPGLEEVPPWGCSQGGGESDPTPPLSLAALFAAIFMMRRRRG